MSYFSLGSLQFPMPPEEITYGGGGHINRHDLIGGGRVYDDMGQDPDDIIFRGKFWGEDREDYRDRLLAMLRTRQTLVWGDNSYDVIVLKAPLSEDSSFYIGYSVTCGVMVDADADSTTGLQAAQVSLAAVSDLTLPSGVNAPCVAASTALQTASDPSTALPSLQTAQEAADDAVEASDATLTGFNPQVTGITVAQFTSMIVSANAALSGRVQASQASALISAASTALGI